MQATLVSIEHNSSLLLVGCVCPRFSPRWQLCLRADCEECTMVILFPHMDLMLIEAVCAVNLKRKGKKKAHGNGVNCILVPSNTATTSWFGPRKKKKMSLLLL